MSNQTRIPKSTRAHIQKHVQSGIITPLSKAFVGMICSPEERFKFSLLNYDGFKQNLLTSTDISSSYPEHLRPFYRTIFQSLLEKKSKIGANCVYSYFNAGALDDERKSLFISLQPIHNYIKECYVELTEGDFEKYD